MKTFIIVDELGFRHATIEAESKQKALEIYFNNMPIVKHILHLAIEKSDVKQFKVNINGML